MGTIIALIYRYSQSYFNEVLKTYGLGNGQYVFLLHLLDHEGINQETLAHMVKIDKTTAARAVARLVAEEDDGRLVQNLGAGLLPGGMPPIRQVGEAGRAERCSTGSLDDAPRAHGIGLRLRLDPLGHFPLRIS